MRRFIFFVLVAICSASGIRAESSLSSRTDSPPACEGRGIPVNETTYAGALSSLTHFLLDLPRAGILAVEAAFPGYEGGSVWVDLDPIPCSTADVPVAARVLSRTTARELLVVHVPGKYRLRVGNLLPDHRIDDLSISTRLVHPESPNPSEPFSIKDGSEGSGSEGSGSSSSSGSSGGTGDNGAEEPDNEIVPLMFRDPASGGRSEAPSWCKPEKDEPRNDLSICALTLDAGEPVSGQLDPTKEVDRDYFSFTLETTSRVYLSTLGATDTFGSLYDQHGHRLARSDDGGEGDNFGLDAILIPGTYTVVVEGTWGDSGPYVLKLAVEEP